MFHLGVGFFLSLDYFDHVPPSFHEYFLADREGQSVLREVEMEGCSLVHEGEGRVDEQEVYVSPRDMVYRR